MRAGGTMKWALLILAVLAASCGGKASQSTGGPALPAKSCADLKATSMRYLQAAGDALVLHDSATAEQAVIDLVTAKRAEEEAGCIAKPVFVAFLRDNANSVATYGCDRCVDVLTREIAAAP